MLAKLLYLFHVAISEFSHSYRLLRLAEFVFFRTRKAWPREFVLLSKIIVRYFKFAVERRSRIIRGINLNKWTSIISTMCPIVSLLSIRNTRQHFIIVPFQSSIVAFNATEIYFYPLEFNFAGVSDLIEICINHRVVQ